MALPRPADEDTLTTQQLVENAYIGVKADGSPALFFRLRTASTETIRRTTGSLELLVSHRFKISVGGDSTVEETPGFVLVLSEPTKLWCFAVLVAQVESALLSNPKAFELDADIEAHLETWIEFFAVETLSLERAIGLWGELYVITCFDRIEHGVACWVGATGQPYDFLGGGLRVEIKTSVRTPETWFSINQIKNKDDYQIVFLRLVPDNSAGSSLEDLVTAIEQKLSYPSEFMKLVALAGYRPGNHRDLKLALEDSFVLPASKIPFPAIGDPRIRQVRFSIDIDQFRMGRMSVSALLKRMARRVKKMRAASDGAQRKRRH